MIAAALIIAGLFIMARAGVQLLFMGIWGVLGLGLLYLMIGHHDSDAVPHVRMSCTTETKYRTSTNKIYDYSTVTFTQNGKRYTAKFVKR